MQSLALPRPTPLVTRPIGRSAEPEDSLATIRSKYSLTRPEQHSYPSPPMSEPHSPVRRPAQASEAVHSSYPTQVDTTRNPKATAPLPPPYSSSLVSRTREDVHGNAQHQSVFPSEHQHRGNPSIQYHSGRLAENHSYNDASHNYRYRYAIAMNPSAANAQLGRPVAQQAALISSPPARPSKPARRTKAHVASACVNCKKAHLSCDVQRPCGRCVTSGKEDSCKDVQHKKRGRPRLRDDRDFTKSDEGRQVHSQILGAPPSSEAHLLQRHLIASGIRQVSDQGYGVASGGSRLELASVSSNTAPLSDVGRASQAGDLGTNASSYLTRPNLPYHSMPVAFLDLDLVIQKSNRAFEDLAAFLGNTKGRHLGDLLDTRQGDSLQRLRNELRDERDEREPAYMAPITPGGQDPMHAIMESVADQDIDHVSQGFTPRPMVLSFRLSTEGLHQSLQVQVRLAKTSLYFVTLAVHSLPKPNVPSLSMQRLRSPTSVRALQPISAPSNGSGAHLPRPASSTSPAPSSPFFNFTSIRTSLPSFSPSSYSGSPSYGHSPTPGPDSGHFSTLHPPPQLSTARYPAPYASGPRNPSVASVPLRDSNRLARLESLQLPPIRTSPPPLGSPLHKEPSQSALRYESERVRQREALLNTEQHRPMTPETGKRRRLNINEVLG